MTGLVRIIYRSVQRGIGRVFDTIGARPIGIVVFAASVALLGFLQIGVGAGIRADAVAYAPLIEHPSRVASFVTNAFVHVGDRVEPGTPLVELSPHFIDRELVLIDAEVEKLLEESKLAQARLLVDEQRWLSPEMRMRPERPSLERPTVAIGAPVNISRPARACHRAGQGLRRSAMVEEAPGQLRGMFRFPVHGMPVYISIPEDCHLGVGQVLSVELARAVM